MSSNLIRLNQSDVTAVEEFAEKVRNHDVTHGVIIYRTVDGDLSYKIVGSRDHGTYYQGMLTRVIHALNTDVESAPIQE
jgi:hypothetical protein